MEAACAWCRLSLEVYIPEADLVLDANSHGLVLPKPRVRMQQCCAAECPAATQPFLMQNGNVWAHMNISPALIRYVTRCGPTRDALDMHAAAVPHCRKYLNKAVKLTAGAVQCLKV